MHYENFLDAGKKAALVAAEIALTSKRNIGSIRFKQTKDIVTQVDLDCDNAIRDVLQKQFPEHSIVSEEFPELRKGGDFTWIVDPIDGTINYSHGIPLWGISLALQRGDETVLGLVYIPEAEEMFWAIRDKGAYRDGALISVSEVTEVGRAVVSQGDVNAGPEARVPELNRKNLEHHRRLADAAQRVKCLGSAVTEACYVACGALDAYVMDWFNPWDVAAGALIVTEAGGKVTRIDGQPFCHNVRNAVFSNGRIHEELLEVLGDKG